MRKNSIVFRTAVFLTLFFQAFSVSAAPTIEPAFEGVLVITSPAGELTLIEPGDPVPAVVSESVIEVFDGFFVVHTEQGDKVTGRCLNHNVKLEEAATARIACAENSGQVTMVDGNGSVTDPAGKVTPLKKGDEFPILLVQGQEPAPATAAGEPLGTEVGQEAPPNSRDLQSSP